MIIQETKAIEVKTKEILKSFKPQYEVVDQDDRGSFGGLAILSNPGKIIFLEWISLPRILLGQFLHIGSRDCVLFIGVYGPHIPREKGVFLQNLKKLRKSYMEYFWIVGRDFNVISSLEEKKGGIHRT